MINDPLNVIDIAAAHSAVSMIGADLAGTFPKANATDVLLATLATLTQSTPQEVADELAKASVAYYKHHLTSKSDDMFVPFFSHPSASE